VVPPRSFGSQYLRAPEFRQQGTPPAAKTAVAAKPAGKVAVAASVPTPRPKPPPRQPAATRQVDANQSGASKLVQEFRREPKYRQGGEPPMNRAQFRKLYDEYYSLPANSPRRAEIDRMIRANKDRRSRID
jgi:hypothetical protein